MIIKCQTIQKQKMSDNYFRFPKPVWVCTIGFGLYLLSASTFSPKSIPSFLGPVGRFGAYLGETYPNGIFGLFVATVLIHAAESVYTVHLARERKLSTSATIKWTIQTFIFGFSSFLKLKAYRPKTR
ncbi:transmembrane protein 254-like [Mytilus edulis]|uniref:transmembrane protein 254-like n=1 Tax=Mytilus edulis TaxID=6550 RepID=UPI0039EF0980